MINCSHREHPKTEVPRPERVWCDETQADLFLIPADFCDWWPNDGGYPDDFEFFLIAPTSFPTQITAGEPVIVEDNGVREWGVVVGTSIHGYYDHTTLHVGLSKFDERSDGWADRFPCRYPQWRSDDA